MAFACRNILEKLLRHNKKLLMEIRPVSWNNILRRIYLSTQLTLTMKTVHTLMIQYVLPRNNITGLEHFLT